MPEQIATSFLLTKLIAGFSGLFGGLCISVFWQPKKIKTKGTAAAYIITGGISFGFPYTFGGAVLELLGLDTQGINYPQAINFLLGVSAVAAMSYLATWLEKREGKDIVEVIREIKTNTKELL